MKTTASTRYFFHAAYKGKHYRGWQRQLNIRSVQQTLEDVLAEILRKPAVTIIGCGRTDAGVHASQYFFHTDLTRALPDRFLVILNMRLPDDIAVYEVFEVANTMHARFAATSRSYEYFISLSKQPFVNDFSADSRGRQFCFESMKKATQLLPRYQDYRAFCKQPDLHNTTICKVKSAHLQIQAEQQALRFSITANRFLRGQIRIIVQKIMDIGMGRFSLAEFEHCLESQQTPKLIKPAPAEGLFLSKINYAALNLPKRRTFAFSEDSWIEI
jgi:tRNA pseudouridine38-40 synthase